jgi:mevalonate kinase
LTGQQYYSNGKLLLTGEYLVLKGAKAMALPLKYGQSLRITPCRNPEKLIWKSSVKNKPWFEAVFDQALNITATSSNDVALRLQQILKKAIQIKGVTADAITDTEITTNLDFNIEWGFGSSSTLLSNIAYWLKTDPHQLLSATSNGSGYDVVAARAEQPIFFTLENNDQVIERARFNPPFRENLYFVYSGKKQRSEESVRQFNSTTPVPEKFIPLISEYTQKVSQASSLESFIATMKAHNEILSEILGQQPPGKTIFSDFEGLIKPLGAWGGDFILAATDKDTEYVRRYFKKKNCSPLFTYNELVK